MRNVSNAKVLLPKPISALTLFAWSRRRRAPVRLRRLVGVRSHGVILVDAAAGISRAPECPRIVSPRTTVKEIVIASTKAHDARLPIDSIVLPHVGKHRRRIAKRTLRPCCVMCRLVLQTLRTSLTGPTYLRYAPNIDCCTTIRTPPKNQRRAIRQLSRRVGKSRIQVTANASRLARKCDPRRTWQPSSSRRCPHCTAVA